MKLNWDICSDLNTEDKLWCSSWSGWVCFLIPWVLGNDNGESCYERLLRVHRKSLPNRLIKHSFLVLFLTWLLQGSLCSNSQASPWAFTESLKENMRSAFGQPDYGKWSILGTGSGTIRRCIPVGGDGVLLVEVCNCGDGLKDTPLTCVKEYLSILFAFGTRCRTFSSSSTMSVWILPCFLPW